MAREFYSKNPTPPGAAHATWGLRVVYLEYILVVSTNLEQGVAISTTAFKLPRFFVQTHIFSVSPSSFSL